MVTLNTIKEILEENKNNISIHECAVYNRPFHVIKNDYGCRRVAQEITFHLSLKKEIPTLSGLNCFFSELLTNLNTPLPKVFPFEWNYILKKNRGFDERGNFLPHDKKGLAGFERILVSFNEIIAKVERKVTVEYNFLFNKENKGQFIRFRKKTKTYKTHTPEEENVYDPFDELTRRIWFVTYFN
ncbi:MAG: hypothetical protein KKH99_14680, partial [Proteobacteria bacterium]|nr:hypothetical protein [Pseudomonadota bacterium]